MVRITPRDIDIFKILASGPLIAQRIRLELAHFKIKYPGNLTDNDDEYKRNMSYGALRQRLSLLKRNGLIASRIFPDRNGNGCHAIYALTERSKEALIRE